MASRRDSSDASSSVSRFSRFSRVRSALSFKSTKGSRPGSESEPTNSNEYGLNTLAETDDSIAIVDLIFIHGLNGGSSSTWSRKNDPDSFWPKEWLPRDPDFQDVRIHSFGYNATWTRRQHVTLDVHDFARYLVEEILNNHAIMAVETPIVLIGHSMGGLVIKKACILSKTNPEFAPVASRLHSLYFLGTPHRGSHLAATLDNILRVSGSRRPYVAGLQIGSELVRTLNDEFRIHYRGIHIHTFYETLPTPPLGRLVVDSESATLGYAEERIQLLNASHRDLCRFENPDDSNYRSLRNRLASTVKQIRAGRMPQQLAPFVSERLEELEPEPDKGIEEQLKTLRDYLSLDLAHEQILASLEHVRLAGSCSWLVAKPSFQQWVTSKTPRYFWLRGPPACGKSVLSSHVIDHLKGHPACYYFFKAGEKSTLDVSSFLRSMAYQMAKANPLILTRLFQLANLEHPIDVRDHRSIWSNLFIGCIFREKFIRPHYWIIDAMDEAIDGRAPDEYTSFLSKIDNEIPLKVLITSRPSRPLDTLFANLPTIRESVARDDSMADIRLYVEKSAATLPAQDSRDRSALIKRIVDKADGSFLWTVLVMQQLSEVYTVDEVHEVLDNVPQEMENLYHKNIKKMESSKSSKGQDIAKHIMTWAMCAIHPLSAEQMQDAVKLSLNTKLAQDPRATVPSLCGQFLVVNQHSQIQVVHETARIFLTSPSLESQFRIDKPAGHAMIALACLKYLLSDDFQYSRRRRSVVANVSRTSIADYAILHLSEHLIRATSASDELFDRLSQFFNTNVLSWIECVAHLKDLHCLVRTSRHLSRYLSRRASHDPSTPPEDLTNYLRRRQSHVDLNAWAVDLPRIVTQFGANLLNDPTAIHTLIPPFCPRNSAIYRHFGYAEDGIRLIGAWNAGWDDRVCSLSWPDTYPTSVASRDQNYAVGLYNGMVKVYRTLTCQEYQMLLHGETVSILEFATTSKLLATASLKRVKLWDVSSGTALFEIRTDSQTLAIAFNEVESIMMIASRNKKFSLFSTSDGKLIQSFSWQDTFVEPRETGNYHTPNAVRISREQEVMAVVYRSKPVQLWSLRDRRPIGACIRQSINKHTSAGHIVNSFVLNPNAAIQRIVVSYWDELVVVFDTTTCRPVQKMTASLDRLAVSPNGKTLAGSEMNGSVIKLYDFESLQFLHQIPIHSDSIISLAFSGDSLRIIDIRGSQSNVWEPTILVSQDSDSSASEPSDSIRVAVDDIESSTIDDASNITVLHCSEESGIALCGRNNGWISTCNLDMPEKTMRNLYKHRGSFTSVTCIDWTDKARVAVSADSAGHFRVMKISTGPRKEWSAELVFENKTEQGRAISQVLINSQGTLVLVSSAKSDSIWSVAQKSCVATIDSGDRAAWKWFSRALSPDELILVQDNIVALHKWSDLSPLASSSRHDLATADGDDPVTNNHVDPDAISIASDTPDLVYAQTTPRNQPLQNLLPPTGMTNTKILVFDILALQQDDSSPQDSVRSIADIPDVNHVIGTFKRFNAPSLLFLSRDSWVCSVELVHGSNSFQKHFFIPSVWQTGSSTLISKVRHNQDVVFVHNDGVVVVKNGLDTGEHVAFL